MELNKLHQDTCIHVFASLIVWSQYTVGFHIEFVRVHNHMGPVCTNYEIWLTTDHTHTTLIPCYSTSILASSTSCVEMINNEHCHTCFHCSSTCVITVRILLKYFLQKSKICRDGGWSYIYRLTKFTYKEWKFMYLILADKVHKQEPQRVAIYVSHM